MLSTAMCTLPWRPTTTMVLLVPMMMIMTGGQVAKAKLPDGKLAAKLDEYHISVKCMANIVEHYVPELNAFMICCSFWHLHDFLLYMVESSCELASFEQLQHLNGLLVPFIRDQCDRQGYEHGSSACQSLLIVPLMFTIIFVLLIVAFCCCSCVSFQQMLRLRRNYRRVIGLVPTTNGPGGSGLALEASAPEMETKRKLSRTSDQI